MHDNEYTPPLRYEDLAIYVNPDREYSLSAIGGSRIPHRR